MEQDAASLLAELEEAYATNRRLHDQLRKAIKASEHAERAAAEAVRAHNKMVETLTETMRENTALTIDRDMWKARAQRLNNHMMEETVSSVQDLAAMFGMPHVTEDEARAIRKAVARLHHPDSGGNAERMKMWNACLDRIERRSSTS